MMKSLSDLEADRDDATGGYEGLRNIKALNTEEKIEKELSERPLHTVPHVDMDAIIEGRERRMTIEESRQRGVELCRKIMNELNTQQSNTKNEFIMEGFIRDDTIDF